MPNVCPPRTGAGGILELLKWVFPFAKVLTTLCGCAGEDGSLWEGVGNAWGVKYLLQHSSTLPTLFSVKAMETLNSRAQQKESLNLKV